MKHHSSAILKEIDPQKVVFAVEISINLWQKLCHFLHKKGFTVLMVSPLYTKHERPKMDNTYSKTDPKDALAVANCARQGYFNFYKEYSNSSDAMHRLSITYDKLKKQVAQTKQRIRSQVELIFPEFNNADDIDTDTARELLRRYLSPKEFLQMNIYSETIIIEKVSQRQHGLKTLKRLQEAAANSIGLTVSDDLLFAEKLTMLTWLNQYQLLKEQVKLVLDKLIELAEQTPLFSILTSLKGISGITASRFIAELRDPMLFTNYKQIETFAGMSLKLSQAGKYTGYRRITHIGNHRFRAIIYTMAEETKNHIPEIRIRYLKRQMKQARYKKNVVACASNMLKLIMSMLKDNHTYQYRDKSVEELKQLEEKYQEFKNKKKIKKSA
ncbi:MAG: transposase [Melioribacteraceae bacterium]|nr:transposase [Melioribacteraceae bacterium]MCF8393130.1 transposase [Melioribacteraceae bacterium]MCF8421236.1 transposase [Melioribacteraceae bacterium]